MKEIVHCQKLDLSSGGQLPLALLRRAVAESPHKDKKLRDVGLVRDGKRVLIKLYYKFGDG